MDERAATKFECEDCHDWGTLDFGVSLTEDFTIHVALVHGTVPCPFCSKGAAERERRTQKALKELAPARALWP